MRVKDFAPALTAAAVLATVLSGCGGSERPAAGPGSPSPSSTGSAASSESAPESPAASDDVLVVQPGAPGEPSVTGSVAPPEPEPWNHADIAFVQMMIPHHAQALQMSRLAPDRAQDPSVRGLAERVEAAQGPEIVYMARLLEQQGVEVPTAADDPMSYDHADHGHDGMVGMLTPEEMEQLRAARGTAFDRRFLEAMIRHHEGALEMAEVVTVEGSDLQVNELAADISVGQVSEIGRMRDVLATLP